MNEEQIKEIALKESSQFLVNELKDGYYIRFNEQFKRWFPDDILSTTQFFIDEAKKKFGFNVEIHKKNNDVFIKKEKQLMNEGILDMFDKTKKFVTDSNREAFSLFKKLGKDLNQRFTFKKNGQGINVYDDSKSYIISINPDGSIDSGNKFSHYNKEDFDSRYNDIKEVIKSSLYMNMDEAEYKGKEVKLGKPMRGDVKKYKVFVKDPKTGNVKKVNFGDKNMEIKRDDPERRKSFRARHKCATAKDRTTPRYWSCRFWGKNPVSDLLNEIIEPDSISVEGFAKKDELCPRIWDDNMQMHEDVRKALLKITKEFIERSDLEDLKFKDIILTGSLANYNWTEQSDLDVHILADFSQISDDKELVGDYLKNKKTLWNERLPIQVKDHDVEMYVQDINEPHTSTGVYSIINDEWSTKPIKEMVALDTGNIQLKTADIMNTIDELEDNKNTIKSVDEIDRVMDKIKKMRKSGLESEGEYSTENIAFKILRRNGYLEKLVNMKNDMLTKELTLENISMYTAASSRDANIKEGKLGDLIKKSKNAGILTLGMVVALLANKVSEVELERHGVPTQLVQKAKNFIETSVEPEIDKFTNRIKGDEIEKEVHLDGESI